MKEFDVFICHAGEDKKSIAKPLAISLQKFGLKVWYDEFTLSPGDSLRQSIEKGLAGSRFGIVILSPSFFSKGWPQYELSGLTAKEIGGRKTVVPIWHNIDREKVLHHSPPLADKLAIQSSGSSPDRMAIRIIETVKPELFTKILRRRAYFETVRKAKKELARVEMIKIGPIRHQKFGDDTVSRIRLIRASLLDGHSDSMDGWIDGFRRDIHPLDEIRWWEHVAACYREYEATAHLSHKQRTAAFSVVFGICLGVSEKELEKHLKYLPNNALKNLRSLSGSYYPANDVKEEVEESMTSEMASEFYALPKRPSAKRNPPCAT